MTMMQVEFNCYICDYKTDNEQNINNHYLWLHNSWRGNCESPNKINIKTEAENLVKEINLMIRKHFTTVDNDGVINSSSGYRTISEIVSYCNRLRVLNWADPVIFQTKKGKNFLHYYQKGNGWDDIKPSLRFTKEKMIKQKDYEDKQQSEENLIKKLIKEVDEEIKQNKNTLI